MKWLWWREGLVILFLLIQAFVAVTIAYQRPVEMTLDLGEPNDLAHIEAFHEAEYNDFYGFSYRWTEGQGEIRLAGVGRARPLWLELVIVGQLDTDGQPILLTIGEDGRVLGQMRLGPIPAGRMQPYRYLLAVPSRPSFSGDLVLQLKSSALSTGTDRRQLGVLVDRVHILYGQGLNLPPLLPALFVMAAALLTYLGTRLAGWGGGLALVLACGVTYPLAVLLNLARLWVVPYLPAFSGMLAISCVLLCLARVVLRREELALPQVFTVIALFAALFSWWQILLIPTPPAYLPATFPLVVSLVFLGSPLLRHIRKKRPTLGLTPAGISASVVLLISLVYAVNFFLWVFGKDYATDFHALFDGVRRFYLAKEPLYQLAAIQQNPFGDLYKYPPLFTLVLLPLARVPFVPALQIWRVVNLLFLVSGAWLVARMYRFGNDLWLWAGLLLIFLNWRPIGDTIAYGQVDILLFLLILGTLAALRGDRWYLAGFLLALATMLKLYPAFLALFFLARREWKALGAFFVSLLFLAGLSVSIMGWPVHATYLFQVLPQSGGGTAWVENQTFNGFFNRLLTDQIALTPETSRWADLAALLASGVLTLATLGLIVRAANKKSLRYDLGFSLLIVTMLLSLPAAWIHYETILVLPFVLLFVYGRELGSLPFKAVALAGISFGLLCFGNAWSVYQREVYGRFWQLLLSYKVYGMLFLWLSLAVLFWLAPRRLS